MIIRWMGRLVVTSLVLAILGYAGDWLIFNLRGGPTAKITVSHFLSTPLKNNKQELDYLGSEEALCSRTLFPQAGHDPCWYLRKHTNQVNNL